MPFLDGLRVRRTPYNEAPLIMSGYMFPRGERDRFPGDGGHELYWELRGKADGRPLLYVPGGPGRGIAHSVWNLFNPKRWKILLFDQRGAGRSQPFGSLVDNTTQHLISDLEELREKWGIDKWTVFGAGAGGTFALAYAQQHPQRVTEVIASHPLLFREQDINWLFKPKVGLSELMPMQFAQFVRPIARTERSNLLEAYHRRFCGDNSAYTTEETRRFVEAWSIWESVNSGIPAPDLADPVAFEQAKNLARIECHYFINRAFLAEGQLLTGMDTLRHHNIPGFIIRGENDLVSPESTSLAIAQAWPEAKMIKVSGTHSLRDPAVQRSILRLTGEIAGCGCLF